MTPGEKGLVRSSWARLLPSADDLAGAFYERLFTIEPNARRLFRDRDMKLQGTVFMQMVGMFIRSLDEGPGVVEAIKASGRRHVAYGVMYSDYDGAGRALLWAIEQVLGAEFTPPVRDAWASAYQSLTATMQPNGTSVL